MRKRHVVVLLILILLIAIQFVPVDRSNPPAGEEIQAPPPVSTVLRRSCYDCHSHETNWPWYSYVAPVSWTLAHHVHEGRAELNFSTWNGLREEKRSELARKIWEETSEGKMPLRGYRFIHRDAKLNAEEIETLRVWSVSSPEKRD